MGCVIKHRVKPAEVGTGVYQPCQEYHLPHTDTLKKIYEFIFYVRCDLWAKLGPLINEVLIDVPGHLDPVEFRRSEPQ